MSAPTVRRRQLGRTLRALREGLGLKQDDVARRSGGKLNGAKISRIETAVTAATAADVALILDACGVEDEDTRAGLLRLTREGARRGWWQSYRSVLSQPYEDLISLESEAEQISTWQPIMIPGLLQTGEYARRIIAATARGEALEDRVTALVQVRLARQAVLTGHAPLTLWAIIGEGALRARTDDPRIMYDQLAHLLAAGRWPNVTIQILPLTDAPHVGLTGAYSILGYGAHASLDVVHIESLTQALYVEGRESVSAYQEAIAELRAQAMSADASAQLITEIRDQT
ncbi:helix-turn-helix domain-containing protein [Streptomyces sp. DT171]|uniref:helix-turn-helix domain-containing protein n=1 Tax=Streptomyces sp. DT171 TaxID=3416524 RepID=UPI003CEFA290